MKNNYTINVSEDNLLYDFLRSKLSNESKNNIKSLLLRKNVYVNDKLQTKYNYELHKGDIISIKTSQFIDEETNIKLKIIYEDKDIIVVDKPSGILTISTEKEKNLTIYHLVMNYLKSKNKNNKVFIIHRLDKDTSGILIFAKSEKIKNLFQNKWNNIIKERRYYAIVLNKLKDKQGVIKSYLKENKNHIVYSTNDKVNGKLAITEYKVIKEIEKYALLDINIKTGRKNQIRVHLSDLSSPIIGDKKYGCENKLIKRLALHAYKLKLIDPRNGKIIQFTSDLPLEMKKIVKM